MAAISMNDSLRELMERTMLLTSVLTDESEILTLKNDVAAGNVTVASLRILRKYMVEMKEVRSLHSYISGSKVTFPTLKPIIAEVSKELISRREYLVLRKEMKEYNMMIYGTEDNPNVQDILTTGNQFASLTNQMTISLNMIVAVFAMFGVGYYVGMQYSDNKTTQMTFGLVSAIGIMIVEMILFIRRATQMEGAYEKKPTALQESNAQMRSGALRISKIPEKISDSHYSNKESTVEKKRAEKSSMEKYEIDSNINIVSKKSN